ncbi:hypothetical protein [Tepidimonas sp.]|uniref:hypothetical protein n=1 Tax=Tepidimonas sp. TaxID=2002775 RepID=UPI0039198F94
MQHVQAAVQAYTAAYKAKAAKEKLESLGYKKLTDIPPEYYAAVIPHFAVAQ